MKKLKLLSILVICFTLCVPILCACDDEKPTANSTPKNCFYLASANILEEGSGEYLRYYYRFGFNYEVDKDLMIDNGTFSKDNIRIYYKLPDDTYYQGYGYYNNGTLYIENNHEREANVITRGTTLSVFYSEEISLFENATFANQDLTWYIVQKDKEKILYSQSFKLRNLVDAAKSGKYTIDYAFGIC